MAHRESRDAHVPTARHAVALPAGLGARVTERPASLPCCGVPAGTCLSERALSQVTARLPFPAAWRAVWAGSLGPLCPPHLLSQVGRGEPARHLPRQKAALRHRPGEVRRLGSPGDLAHRPGSPGDLAFWTVPQGGVVGGGVEGQAGQVVGPGWMDPKPNSSLWSPSQAWGPCSMTGGGAGW